MRKLLFTLSILILICPATTMADQQIISKRVAHPPTIDGKGTDSQWSKAATIITHDLIAKKKITLKSLHTDNELFFLVQYPDDKEERQHKTLTWDSEMELYRAGPQREDSFVIKWSMEPDPV